MGDASAVAVDGSTTTVAVGLALPLEAVDPFAAFAFGLMPATGSSLKPRRSLGNALVLGTLSFGLLQAPSARAQTRSYAGHTVDGPRVVLRGDDGVRVQITSYGPKAARVQTTVEGEDPPAEARYETLVAPPASGTPWVLHDDGPTLALVPASGPGLEVHVSKNPLKLAFVDALRGVSLLTEADGGPRTGDRPLALTVNGTLARGAWSFPRTHRWDTWGTVTTQVMLPAGTSVVRLSPLGESGANVDALTVTAAGSGPPPGHRAVYQAEAGAFVGAAVSQEHGGFTGTGYVDFAAPTNAFLEWRVTVPSSGAYTLAVRYANGASATLPFVASPGEHVAGLGHGPFGRVAKLDLAASRVRLQRANQAPLLVPFFLSSRGYGLFVNTPYATEFAFEATGTRITQTAGPLDYVVVGGTDLTDVLDGYTALTGRPRLPPLAVLGLGLSDKMSQTGSDGQGALVSDDPWWRAVIDRMRAGGFPMDVVVHDNAWRNAKTGPWAWDRRRYPDPAAFAAFCRQRGVVNMLDFNRADASYSEGWQPSFRMPGTPETGEGGGWMDVTRPEVRRWFWRLLFTKAFDPQMGYPADLLWLDEPDEDVEPSAPLGDGRTWDEVGAMYTFLLAKAVGEGWDQDMAMAGAAAKRPFVMTRGSSAGAQRWSTLWSGDIAATDDEMRLQVRGMLAAGLSGFPFWAHDAGGFWPDAGPSLALYRRWAMAFGSFSPVWKPHGPGLRFPWDRYAEGAGDARLYGGLRMSLLPYLYALAHQAHARGTPVARPMFLADASLAADDEAWARDLQYMWGPYLLVAPDAVGNGEVAVWLPPGRWFDFWTDTVHEGPAELRVPTAAADARLPLFVRAGAVLPRTGEGAMASTRDWDHGRLAVHVYAGADGRFDVVEDDGQTEAFTAGAVRHTAVAYDDGAGVVGISAAAGTFAGAPGARVMDVVFHGLAGPRALAVDGVPRRALWDEGSRTLTVTTDALPVDRGVRIGPPDTGTHTADGGAVSVAAAPVVVQAPSDVPSVDGGCTCAAVRARGAPSFPRGAWALAAVSVAAARRRPQRASRSKS